MANETKLVVILHADVVGSTELVQKDEELAHRRMRDVFHRLAERATAHHGRPREIRGDAIVIEFGRASDAGAAALEFQEENRTNIDGLNDDICPVLRIGIALGEVILADNTVTGAGVVLAQRLEQFAEPGGVCVSAAIREALPARLSLEFQDLGELELKGFEFRQRAYLLSSRVGKGPLEAGRAPSRTQAAEGTATERTSIAVLPFDNLSSDPDQEYFADGIAEDITSALSRFHWFFVIARNSSFQFKGQAVDVRSVAEQLGVRYVLEGSVRKASQRVRVTAQLIDASTGNHVWVERYDRDLDDIFQIQDEITQRIAGALEGAITLEEQRRARISPTESLDAWAAYHLGMHAMAEAGLANDSAESASFFGKAREYFERAYALDAGFARPLSAHALVLRREKIRGLRSGTDAQAAIEKGLALCDQAIALDPQDGIHRAVRGSILGVLGDWRAALEDIDAAILSNPNSALAYFHRGFVKSLGFWPEQAIADLEMATKLSPLDSDMGGRYPIGAWAQLRIGEYAGAIEWAERGVREVRSLYWPALDAACGYVALGQHAQAETLIEEALKRKPDLSVTSLIENMVYLEDEDHKRWFLDCLQQAGLPD